MNIDSRIIFKDCEKISFRLSSIENLKDVSLFLTGGTGFFGKWILQTICILNDQFKRNIQVTCLTRDSSRFLKKYPLFDRLDINFIEGDVRKFTIPNKHFDLVIHAATETSTRTSNNQDIQSVILDGMDHMLDFVKQCGVSRFLFTSSGGVYGEMPQGQKSFSETMLPHPSSLYGKAKLEAECNCLLRSQQEGWIGTIARCFSFVGPYLPLDANFAIGDFVQDVLMNSPIIIQGDGTAIRSYMYASDLVEWLFVLLLCNNKSTIYNVGSPHPISILNLAHHISEASLIPITMCNQIKNKGIKSIYVPDTTRIQEKFKLELTIPLSLGIKQTIEFYKNNY